MAKADVGVDGYIARQAREARPVLRRVRSIIRKVLPRAEETISYQIPTYRLHGQNVVYFAGWKRHWSLYPMTEPVRQALGPALSRYEFSRGTLRFPLAEPVPTRLVQRILRALAKAAEGRSRGGATTRNRRARHYARQRGTRSSSSA